MRFLFGGLVSAGLLALLLPPASGGRQARGGELIVKYAGGEGPGRGKQVVLVSGDEEYRSEEALPQLAKILARHHGFNCTVLFAIDAQTGTINPNVQHNIPGLEALQTADLMVIFVRFRGLPDDQMRHLDAYLRAGKPVLGMRTSTHAFRFPDDSPWARYSNGYQGDNRAWQGGFGRLVLGEKWISHHGSHKHESTRGVIAPEAAQHPVTRGLDRVDLWGCTDVYGVRLPLPGDSQPIVLGQVIPRKGPFLPDDRFYGMRPDDGPPVEGTKNQPMMPIAWTKTYQVPGGQAGRAMTSTMGASVDLLSAGVRRLLVNGVYWCLGLEDQIPEAGTQVPLVGDYQPTAYAAQSNASWRQRALRPSAFQGE